MHGPESAAPAAGRAAGGPTAQTPAGGRAEPPASGLSAHILPTSATMIGVCLTALYISLLGPAGTSRVMVDKLLAVDALVFLVSATLSFVSMRSGRRTRRFEARAEAIFLAGLGLLAMVAMVLAFAVN
jgi:hypothetical protein